MGIVQRITGGVLALVMAAGCSTTAQTCSTAEKPASKPPASSVAEATPVKTVNYDKPGFVTAVVKGRLWVFAEGSPELASYKESKKTPAIHATRVKAGPDGMTIIAPDLSVLEAYMK